MAAFPGSPGGRATHGITSKPRWASALPGNSTPRRAPTAGSARTQLPDGSWWASYRDGEVLERGRRETNFVAYIATGLWHHYLVSGNGKKRAC